MSDSANPCDDPKSCNEVSCRLSADELKAQRNNLIPGLFNRSEKVDELQDGFRFIFSNRPNLLIELAELIEKEQVCCSFLQFTILVEEGAGSVSLEVNGPPGTVELLQGL
ncbi:MAG: hypothetical protein AAGB13_15910 [Cyanobacteria bacterium P01_F01_bin.33]